MEIILSVRRNLNPPKYIDNYCSINQSIFAFGAAVDDKCCSSSRYKSSAFMLSVAKPENSRLVSLPAGQTCKES